MSADGDDGDASVEGDIGQKQHREKVWNKVSWFGRRCDRDVHTQNIQTRRPISWGSTSSSEGDIGEMQQRRRLSPNSEILEQNCLKQRTTKTMFLRLESLSDNSSNHNSPSSSNLTKKNQCNSKVLDGDVMSRTTSMPEGVIPKELCHCLACCNCTTSERLTGQCPAYLQRCASTRSLDTALSELEYSLAYHNITCQHAVSESTYEGSDVDDPHQKTDTKTCKRLSPTKFLPNYFSQSLLRKCKFCSKVLGQCHLPVSTTKKFNIPALPPSLDYCDCKGLQEVSKLCSSGEETVTPHTPLIKDKVSAVEFKAKSQVSLSQMDVEIL